MSDPNLRDLVGDIRQALEQYPPDALVDMLTYIFKEYVVEEPAPIASAFTTAHDPLEGLGFAELIRTLQLKLDLPELGLFDVQGDRVFVKLGGQRMLVEAPASRSEPVPTPMAAPSPPLPLAPSPPSEAPKAAPGTMREELPLAAMPRPARSAPSPSSQPTPAAAAATSKAPTSGATKAAEGASSTTPQPGTGPGKEEPASGKDPSKFNLLEVD